MTLGLIESLGALAIPIAGVLGWVYRRFRKTATNEIESFTRYVGRGIKYYVGRYVQRQLAAELTVRQYARIHLRGTGLTMTVPARYPVHLRVDDVFVPLLLRGPTDESLDYHDLIDRSSSRLVIVGEPGSGKSSLMKRSFRDACRRANADPRHAQVPVLFEFNQLSRLPKEDQATLDHVALFDLCLRNFESAAVFTAEGAKEHLQHGPGYLLLLDGLDEVPSEASAVVARAVAALAQHLSLVSPRSSVIVSTRTQHYIGLQDRSFRETFRVLSIRPFSLADMYQFLLRWPFVRARKDHITRLFSRVRSLPSLTDMCTNPLALSMFVARDQQTEGIVSPETRSEFYAALVDELLVNRRIRREEDSAGRLRLRELRGDILGTACLGHLLDAEEAPNSVPQRRFVAAAQSIARVDRVKATQLVEDLAVDTGLFSTERSGESYRFMHLTLCEFFAARELVNQGSAGWAVVARLLELSPNEGVPRANWAARLLEVVAFSAGLAPRHLRDEILGKIASLGNAALLTRAAIESQSYDDPAIAQALRVEGEALRAASPQAWDVDWFSRLRSYVAVLRDTAGGARPKLGTASVHGLPDAPRFLTGLIDRHGAEEALLATLARNDAEAAVSLAERAGRTQLMDIVARTADDFSVLVAVLARCEAGVHPWKVALVHTALRQRQLANVLMSTEEEVGTASGDAAWERSFVMRGSVYGRLLASVLDCPSQWRPDDRGVLTALARVRPPVSIVRTVIRPLFVPLIGLLIVAAPNVFLLSSLGKHEKNPSDLVLVAATGVAAAAVLAALRNLRSDVSRYDTKRGSGEPKVGGLSIGLAGLKIEISSRAAEEKTPKSVNSEEAARLWRLPVLEETLNLTRFRFAALGSEAEPKRPSRAALLASGVGGADIDALLAARTLRGQGVALQRP
jgi:hypothetical protein